jgi:DNA-binding NarL/FixJ family response regulator
MIAAAQTAYATQCGPKIALHATDELRRRRLERDLRCFANAEAEPDVMVVHLPEGESLPVDASTFDGAVLVLSDDPAIARDKSLLGVLPATADARQISAAVRALAAGLTVRLQTAMPVEVSAPTLPVPALLTPRESEVLALVGEGMSNKTIARKLGISAHTVKYHLEAVFAKLGVRSRAEAVSSGLRQGLLAV